MPDQTQAAGFMVRRISTSGGSIFKPAKPEPKRLKYPQETQGAGGEVEAAADGALPRAPRRVLSSYDRIIVTGTLPGACYAKGMTGFLSARQIPIFDYPRFAEPLRDRVRERAAELASAAGITIEHIAKKPHPQGGRHRQGACRPWRPSRPGAYHLGDGSL